MPGVSIHVVDVSRGVVAAGMGVELYAIGLDAAPRLIATGTIAAGGTWDEPLLQQRFLAGVYEARFHVAAFYREVDVALPRLPFLDVVVYRFGIDDGAQHYHLPFKCTPWGYSCFRGGA